MTGIGGVAGAGIGAGLAVGGATAIMAGMPGMGASAVKGTEASAQSGGRAPGIAAGGDKSPVQELAKKLDDIMTTALLLELMDKKKGEGGMVDALVAVAAVSLYKQMQSLESAGASASVAGVTISITA